MLSLHIDAIDNIEHMATFSSNEIFPLQSVPSSSPTLNLECYPILGE